MRLIIDGDACPAKKQLISLAKKYQVEVILITSVAHYSDYSDCNYIIVDNYPQAVDMAVINRTVHDDVVLTGDFGLASIILKKGARAISPRGIFYHEKKMDELLLKRHLVQKELKAGKKVKGPARYTKSDLHRLLRVLEDVFRKEAAKFDENN